MSKLFEHYIRNHEVDEFTAEDRAYMRKLKMLSPAVQVSIKAVIDAFAQSLSYPVCGERRKGGRDAMSLEKGKEGT